MESVVLSGLSALRWAAWVWMAVVLAVSRHDLLRPWLAFALVGAALVYTVVATGWVRGNPSRLMTPRAVSVEMALAVGLVVGDGWVYGSHHAFSTSQSLGSVWPLVAVLSSGVAFGARWGVAAGALLGIARLGATLANGVRTFDGSRVLSLASTAVFYVTAGAVAAYVVGLLRQAEREISAARAREEVARTLHDGVLQTLAIVERRSTDQALVRLAREQDRELRSYLFGHRHQGDEAGDLGSALRRSAARFEDAFGIRAEVLVAGDLPPVGRATVDAVAGAVSEALTNAGKHAEPRRVVVFVEPAAGGGLFCSVKDDGSGFHPGGDPGGVGIARSIIARMSEVGGRAEIRSRPGQGTEVCLWA